MALSIDPATRVISVPQADLTPLGGTFYSMDTEVYFRQGLMDLLDDEDRIWLPDAFRHNTTVTIAGVTYARFIEVINSYTVQFTPNTQWTVLLEGSNNNIFDVGGGILVQNQVQVIPTNSAGLIQITSGSGLSVDQATQLDELWKLSGLDAASPMNVTPTSRTAGAIDLDLSGDPQTSVTVQRQ